MTDKYDEMAREAVVSAFTMPLNQYEHLAASVASALRQVAQEKERETLELSVNWLEDRGRLCNGEATASIKRAGGHITKYAETLTLEAEIAFRYAQAIRALSPTPTEDVSTPGDGYVRVPREPSEEMIKAGISEMPVIVRYSRDHNGWHAQPIYRGDPGWVCPSNVYRAMIQAAEKGE